MIRYYLRITSKSGKKFIIYYIKKKSFWKCNKCNRIVEKNSVITESLTTETIPLPSNKTKTITTEVKTTLLNKKDRVVCGRGLKEGKCAGELIFAGWKIWVEDITNEKVTSFEGIGVFRNGSIIVETCFVDMRDKIDYKVQTLQKKYEEM